MSLSKSIRRLIDAEDDQYIFSSDVILSGTGKSQGCFRMPSWTKCQLRFVGEMELFLAMIVKRHFVLLSSFLCLFIFGMGFLLGYDNV